MVISYAYNYTVYWVSQERGNGEFSVPCDLKVSYFYLTKYKVSIFHRREWYQDHWIWFSNFDSMPISGNTVIFKFRLIFATDERRIVSGRPFIWCFGEAHLSVSTKQTVHSGPKWDFGNFWFRNFCKFTKDNTLVYNVYAILSFEVWICSSQSWNLIQLFKVGLWTLSANSW